MTGVQTCALPIYYITYTPGFGDFKDVGLEEYLIKYVKDNKLSASALVVAFIWLRNPIEFKEKISY